MRRKLVAAAALLVLIAIGAAAALYLYNKHLQHGVQGSSTVEFTPTAAPKAPKLRTRSKIEWDQFGDGPQRTHVGPATKLKRPFRVRWVAGGSSLLEFPPAVGYGRLYIANAGGDLIALNAQTGRRAWTVKTRRCVASSPALGRYELGTVYESFLGPHPCGRKKTAGEVIAVAAGSGDIRWRRTIGPTETSPLLVGRHLYVGDWRGHVYDLDARTGHVLWTATTRGAIKSAVARSGRRLFVGSYDGHVYCLDAKTGRQLWRASSDARLFGHGRFYSSPAIAYGRVYIGSTDRRVYSYGATTGKRRWSYVTGGYVYGSPSVWDGRVYIGSYDGWFYGLDAATGRRVWRFHANGPISGSSTVLNGLVYFATLKGRTYALSTRTGKLVWTFGDGKYAPVTTDGRRLFLVGYAKVYGLVSPSLERTLAHHHHHARKQKRTKK
ncbi:MAG TPA: PQQ-binding-like beta-propeller repeat protein [Gaiellaceae bacterium]